MYGVYEAANDALSFGNLSYLIIKDYACDFEFKKEEGIYKRILLLIDTKSDLTHLYQCLTYSPMRSYPHLAHKAGKCAVQSV